MASKKYTLLALLVIGAITGSYAQLAGIHNYTDSSKVPAKRMAQQNEWVNNSPTQPFPAKPRDQWQVGGFIGYMALAGDIPVNGRKLGYNYGFSVRKSLSYVFSLRGTLAYGNTFNLQYKRDNTFFNHSKNLDVYKTVNGGPGYYIHNSRTRTLIPTLDLIVSLNNIMFHSKASKWNIYVYGGYSPLLYDVQLNVLDGSPAKAYNLNGLGSTWNQGRTDIQKALNNLFDNGPTGKGYETPGAVRSGRRSIGSGGNAFTVLSAITLGAGIERKLNNNWSLGADIRTIRGDDYLDGYYLNGPGTNGTNTNSDALYMANLHLNVNLFGGKGKRVAPLWWLNPLGYSYGELNTPSHMKFPKPVLDDTDNDGVADQFDLEPNTPAGCPVDTRGRSRDTDNDGVPDCRDKELITPTTCQPVNADGVGTCPDPKCCKDIPVPPPTPVCAVGSLPSVQFAAGKVKVSATGEGILSVAAAQIKANPACKIGVIGHGGASKREQQLSWDRVNSVINYLVEKHSISRDRFVFKYGEVGDASTVDLQDLTGDNGTNYVPAPHPQYSKTN